MNKLPDCYCDQEGINACDWKVEMVVSYSRPGHPEAIPNKVEWELDKVPNLLAQAALQLIVKGANEQGAKLYLAWGQGCANQDTPEEMAGRVMDV